MWGLDYYVEVFGPFFLLCHFVINWMRVPLSCLVHESFIFHVNCPTRVLHIKFVSPPPQKIQGHEMYHLD